MLDDIADLVIDLFLWRRGGTWSRVVLVLLLAGVLGAIAFFAM